jgi:hypothetical protein
MADKNITEGRLRAALQRILDGKPIRVKQGGKLSLNKINNEAGLGHSYIHKFVDFVENEANPKIKSYNKNLVSEDHGDALSQDKLTDVEKLKANLKRERALKEKYRQERDDAIAAQKHMEQSNNNLMFRIHELQQITKNVRSINIVD